MGELDKNKKDERDEFWDISALLPQRKNRTPRSPRSTETVEITISPRGGESGEAPETALSTENPLYAKNADDSLKITSRPPAGNSEETGRWERSGSPSRTEHSKPQSHSSRADEGGHLVKKFIPPYTAQDFDNLPKPDDEYEPRHPLIHRVKVFNWKTSYNYYEQFLIHAGKIRNIGGKECPHVSFFSYVPQYSQLSREQLAWYLWWRKCAAGGEYLATDYSYIMLFVYEIINTGGHGNPAWGQRQLCGLWRAYREEYPRLDKLLGEWICDFSLIYHLPAHPALTEKIPAAAVAACTLKEFYMASGSESPGESPNGYCRMLLEYCSNYDYKGSKFAAGDALVIFTEHIHGALAEVVRKFSEAGGHLLSGAGFEDSRMTRDAFAGALCSYKIKKKLEIEYCSFSRSHELRFIVTDIIKYSENKLRAHLGVKSRLSIYALPTNFRECIDEYFSRALPKKQKALEVERNEYDKFYDLPAAPASAERAAEIERISWETTGRLLEAFEDETGGVAQSDVLNEPMHRVEGESRSDVLPPAADSATPRVVHPTDESDAVFTSVDIPLPARLESASLAAALGELFEFVTLASQHDYSAQREFAARRGEPTELVADKINEIAAGILGDIILTESGCGGYDFIEDYRDDVFGSGN